MSEDSLYERLLELWMRERTSEKLNKFPDEILKDLSAHVAHLRRQLKLSERGTINSVLRSAEIAMIQRMLESLFRMRLRKIMMVGDGEPPLENMLPFEKRYYNNLSRAVQEHTDAAKSILTNLQVLHQRRESRYEVVIFLKDFPKIVGEDLVSYGPFREGDVATLPAENASLLAGKSVVKLVRVP